jgi:hypothetical protein
MLVDDIPAAARVQRITERKAAALFHLLSLDTHTAQKKERESEREREEERERKREREREGK